MRCPSCGSGSLAHGARDETIRYKGEAITVHDLAGHRCADCGETVFDPESYDRYRAASDGLISSVNRRNAPDLRRVRKKLGLTQAEAGRLFGGGVSAFSRYERGETQPPVALAKLFLLLDRHPELLDELRKAS
ncbi:MAG: type II TA system antitoxin MqsA family protein [Deferrisomatales bacterium]